MDFDSFINKGWQDHADDSKAVAEWLPNGLELIDEAGKIPAYCAIVVHVFGEHLGQWQEAKDLLAQVEALPFAAETDQGNPVLNRSKAVLTLGSGDDINLDSFSKSDQIRIFAITTSAMAGQNQASKAIEFFQKALDLASDGLPQDDPANQSLAVSGNNLACTMEELESRSDDETNLMLLAATTGRHFWEISGTWTNVERAEYRLANSHLKAGNSEAALQHAKNCLEICAQNDAPALELFFGKEVQVLAERASGNADAATLALTEMKTHFDDLADEDKSWCETSLNKLLKQFEEAS